jgi:predicted kinase
MRIGKEKRMLHALRVMSSTICIIGGCNGAGKSTLARELLPRLGIGRFLNADLIAKGLSPVNPALAAFAAGRRLLEEASGLIEAGSSFAIESTLSGKTYVKLLREAKRARLSPRAALHRDRLGHAGGGACAAARAHRRPQRAGERHPPTFRAQRAAFPGGLSAACR